MSRDITITLRVDNQASQPLQQFNTDIAGISTSSQQLTNSTKETGTSLDTVANNVGKMALAWVGWRGINAVSDMFQLGQSVNIASSTFGALTSGIGGSQVNLQALQEATGGVVDNMTLLAGANKLLQMGLVTNTDELSSMSSMAVKLGATMGMDATKAMSDFSLMLANNSIMRLDQFGISSGRVKERIQELQDATAGLSRSDAFKMAVMEEGAKALDRLGNAATAAETPINRISASISNMAQSFSANFSTGANSLVGMIQLAAGSYPGQQDAANAKAFDSAKFGQQFATTPINFDTMQGYLDMAGVSKGSDAFVSQLMFTVAEALKNDPNADVGKLVADKLAQGWANGEKVGPQDVQGYIDAFNATWGDATAMMEIEAKNKNAKLQKELYKSLLAGDSGRDYEKPVDVQAEQYAALLALPDERQASVAAQREAQMLADSFHNAMNGVSGSLTSAFGTMGFDTQYMDTSLFTQKLDPQIMQDMVPKYMEQSNADAITKDLRTAQDEFAKLQEMSDKKLIPDAQLENAKNMVDNLDAMATQAQKAADAFKNLTLGEAFGQTSGGMKGEMTDMVIQQMKDKGYGKTAIANMQNELDMSSGRQTESSEVMKNQIVPMIAKMTAKQAAVALSNVDAFLKEATLQGMSEEQIAAMLPEVVSFDQENHTRDITQKEIDAQRAKWEKDQKKEKKKNKDGTYDYTGRFLDDLGKVVTFTPDMNQKVNYTTFTGGADFSQGNSMQELIAMLSGNNMAQPGNGMGGAGSIFDDEKTRGKGKGGKSDGATPTAAMAGDLVNIKKDSVDINKNFDILDKSVSSIQKAGTTFAKAIESLPAVKTITLKLSADDPSGILGLLKASLGGGSMAEIVKNNGGNVPGAGV